jgi:acetyl-CoA carboxylase biotin carboxyl carrier protein
MALFDKKDDIFELMEKFEKGSIAELEIDTSEGMRVRLSKFNPRQVYLPEQPTVASSGETSYSADTVMLHIEDMPAAATAGEPVGDVIKAPIIGTFYSSSSPEAEPYVKVGDRVSKGAVVCILEAMKVMNEIDYEQDYDCEIVEILVNNGDLVEYGQPLFRVK